jgi:hypothetical protein
MGVVMSPLAIAHPLWGPSALSVGLPCAEDRSTKRMRIEGSGHDDL